MDQHQRELRRAAAQAFIESLDQLAECFQAEGLTAGLSEQPPMAEPEQSLNQTSNQTSSSPTSDLDLQALEAAAADIERFMQDQ